MKRFSRSQGFCLDCASHVFFFASLSRCWYAQINRWTMVNVTPAVKIPKSMNRWLGKRKKRQYINTVSVPSMTPSGMVIVVSSEVWLAPSLFFSRMAASWKSPAAFMKNVPSINASMSHSSLEGWLYTKPTGTVAYTVKSTTMSRYPPKSLCLLKRRATTPSRPSSSLLAPHRASASSCELPLAAAAAQPSPAAPDAKVMALGEMLANSRSVSGSSTTSFTSRRYLSNMAHAMHRAAPPNTV
mmetsp:Transcript_9682/g.17029  ORF Transcript_9682/g.17029 Transcript_9682/m.17029 type:complete len:242 (-) Transcript_9682:58-783(-)